MKSTSTSSKPSRLVHGLTTLTLVTVGLVSACTGAEKDDHSHWGEGGSLGESTSPGDSGSSQGDGDSTGTSEDGSTSGSSTSLGTTDTDGSSGGDGDVGSSTGDSGEDTGEERGCRQDDDCLNAGLSICDPARGCVECLFDWDCPADHLCSDRECEPRATCKQSSDCEDQTEKKLCDDVVGYCVQCRWDTECGDAQRCERNACVDVEPCQNSRDCSSAKVCDRTQGACVQCNADGDCSGDSACVNQECVPNCASDKQCVGLGLLCDQTLGRCTECLSDTDCPEVYYCGLGGTCELDVCVSAESRCETESVLATCNPSGSGYDFLTCSHGSSCVEGDTQATCEPWLCTPSASDCSQDHTQVVACSEDGFSVLEATPCPEGEACTAGACEPIICTPGQNRCNDAYYQALERCNESGTAWEFIDICYSGTYCDEESGSCTAQICTPDRPSCDGDTVRTCDATGTGYSGIGTDCSQTGQACYGGQCKDILCEGSFECQGADLYRCDQNGTRTSLDDVCLAASLCDDELGTCRSPVCAPGAYVCDENVATRCDEEGGGYVEEGLDCTDSGQICDGGGCLPKICEPNQIFCDGGNPFRCGTKGTTRTQTDTCSSSEFCKEGNSYCAYDVCSNGAAICDDNIATTCLSDGSGPVKEGGIDCGDTDQVCEAGVCKDVVCTPGERWCVNQTVVQCNSLGSGTTNYDTCSSYEYCEESGTSAQCVADICTAGAVGCDGEVISTCSATGGDWESPGVDCRDTDQVCVFGACADEEVGSQGYSYSSTYLTDYTNVSMFEALSSRTLTQLEMYGRVTSGTQKITWVVYEKRPSSTNSYDLIFQKVATISNTTNDWVSSGTIQVPIEAGKSYAVGVHSDGSVYHSYYSTSSSAYYANVSFARNESCDRVPVSGSQPDTVETFYAGDYFKTMLRYTTKVAQP